MGMLAEKNANSVARFYHIDCYDFTPLWQNNSGLSKQKERIRVYHCKSLLFENEDIDFNKGEYAICCEMFTNKMKFYYIDSNTIRNDIVICYCDSLEVVNKTISTLKNSCF